MSHPCPAQVSAVHGVAFHPNRYFTLQYLEKLLADDALVAHATRHQIEGGETGGPAAPSPKAPSPKAQALERSV